MHEKICDFKFFATEFASKVDKNDERKSFKQNEAKSFDYYAWFGWSEFIFTWDVLVGVATCIEYQHAQRW